MGDVRRLDRCYRCRKVFATRAGERYCPDCRREMRRERNRRRLGLWAFGRSSWAPVAALAALTLVGGALDARGAWVGAALAVAAVWTGVLGG